MRLGWSLILVGAVVGTRAEAAPLALPVRGYHPAAYLKASRAGSRPLVVGLHGNFDRPEWFCESLEPLLEGRAHALCPRGVPRTEVPREADRWTLPPRGRLKSEIDAGIKVLRAVPGVTIADGPVLLAGFSLGAINAARLGVESPRRYPRLYLVEGGHAVWTAEALGRFARQGGRGLVFGCGHAGCTAQSERICRQALKLRLTCQVVSAKNLGHSYTDPLPGLARPSIKELLAGDERW
jgi:pimeloyl-ACP methyl ester carboxylesterase